MEFLGIRPGWISFVGVDIDEIEFCLICVQVEVARDSHVRLGMRTMLVPQITPT
jgi:hypothetical protein